MNLLCDIKLVGEYRKLGFTEKYAEKKECGLWQEICQEEFEDTLQNNILAAEDLLNKSLSNFNFTIVRCYFNKS